MVCLFAVKKKATRRIRDWGEYNASLKKRGSLKIWISSEAIANWTTDELNGKSGAIFVPGRVRRDRSSQRGLRLRESGDATKR